MRRAARLHVPPARPGHSPRTHAIVYLRRYRQVEALVSRDLGVQLSPAEAERLSRPQGLRNRDRKLHIDSH